MKPRNLETHEYRRVANNVLPGGLTLLQVGPDYAVDLRPNSRSYGWLFSKHPDGQFVTCEHLTGRSLDQAVEQAGDYSVLYPKVRFG